MLIFVTLLSVVASAVVTSAYSDDDGVLYYTRNNTIVKRGMRPDATETELLSLDDCPSANSDCEINEIDFDCKERKIYFSSFFGKWIKTANLDGSDVKTPLKNKRSSDMAIDWSSKNIYYIADGSDSFPLVVASLDGKYEKMLVNDRDFYPEKLVIDLENRHLYFEGRGAKLLRVNLDGTGLVTLLTATKISGLVLLQKKRELCWFNIAKMPYFLECMNLDSKVRRTVFAPNEAQQMTAPFRMTVYKEKRFFYTNFVNKEIHSVTLDGDQYFSFQVNPSSGPWGLRDLLAEPPSCPEVTTACAVNNGGCSYLCLPTDTGAKCVCPDEPKGLKGC